MTPQIYIVGGAIRDKLMGITPTDTDYVAVGYSPQHFIDKKYLQVGKNFPVFLNTNGEEIALARVERKVSTGTMGIVVNTDHVTLEQDLYRRDLRINSMAMTEDGTIIDLYGGQEDIKNKILRHTSSAFIEDPVRVLRLARFRAKFGLDWKIHKDTKVLVYSMRTELKSLQPDRIWKEVKKVLASPNSYIFFETLFELGVLDVIFPHLYDLTTLKEGNKHHREASAFEHTMRVLQCVSGKSNRLQLAALFHDIAKPLTYREVGDSSGHECHVKIPEMIQQTLLLPRILHKNVLFLVNNHTKIYKFNRMKSSSIAAYLYQYHNSLELLEEQVTLGEADNDGRITLTEEKEIDRDSILAAGELIKEYSPAIWIQKTNPTNAEHIKQHIHRYNIGIVRRYYD